MNQTDSEKHKGELFLAATDSIETRADQQAWRWRKQWDGIMALGYTYAVSLAYEGNKLLVLSDSPIYVSGWTKHYVLYFKANSMLITSGSTLYEEDFKSLSEISGIDTSSDHKGYGIESVVDDYYKFDSTHSPNYVQYVIGTLQDLYKWKA